MNKLTDMEWFLIESEIAREFKGRGTEMTQAVMRALKQAFADRAESNRKRYLNIELSAHYVPEVYGRNQYEFRASSYSLHAEGAHYALCISAKESDMHRNGDVPFMSDALSGAVVGLVSNMMRGSTLAGELALAVTPEWQLPARTPGDP